VNDFRHERRITDEIRLVDRAIARCGGVSSVKTVAVGRTEQAEALACWGFAG
jgi:hypothetical protein